MPGRAARGVVLGAFFSLVVGGCECKGKRDYGFALRPIDLEVELKETSGKGMSGVKISYEIVAGKGSWWGSPPRGIRMTRALTEVQPRGRRFDKKLHAITAVPWRTDRNGGFRGVVPASKGFFNRPSSICHLSIVLEYKGKRWRQLLQCSDPYCFESNLLSQERWNVGILSHARLPDWRQQHLDVPIKVHIEGRLDPSAGIKAMRRGRPDRPSTRRPLHAGFLADFPVDLQVVGPTGAPVRGAAVFLAVFAHRLSIEHARNKITLVPVFFGNPKESKRLGDRATAPFGLTDQTGKLDKCAGAGLGFLDRKWDDWHAGGRHVELWVEKKGLPAWSQVLSCTYTECPCPGKLSAPLRRFEGTFDFRAARDALAHEVPFVIRGKVQLGGLRVRAEDPAIKKPAAAGKTR